jgi:glyoxylase-like metal-dependent hydrolase (beta-lactamase superfamily II)
MKDGYVPFAPTDLAANAEAEDVSALMQQHNLNNEFSPLPIGITLIRNGNRLVLMDTGGGSSEFATGFFGENIGQFTQSLGLLGVAPEDITDVVHSHYHPDHLGGTLVDGNVAFPNAQHYLSQMEWEFIQSDDVVDYLLPFVDFANHQLQPLVDNDGQLSFYGDEDEIIPGIQAIATPGHSAGHHSFLVASNGQQALLPFDVFAHPVLHLRHPEWFMNVDQIPELAVETRQALLARAADEQIPLLAFHFPFPGVGTIARDGDAYRFTPTS